MENRLKLATSTMGIRPYTSEYTAVYLGVYGRILKMGGQVYGRILAVYGRILGVYGRIPWVYGRIHKVYGRIPRPWHWVGETCMLHLQTKRQQRVSEAVGLGNAGVR